MRRHPIHHQPAGGTGGSRAARGASASPPGAARLQESAEAAPAVQRLRRLQARADAGATVLQPYWELVDGKAVWKDGAAPDGYEKVEGMTKKGAPVFRSPEARVTAEDAARREKERKRAERQAAVDARSRPETRRRDFSSAERRRLASIPERLVREDDDFSSSERKGRDGRKAHLSDGGLYAAGPAPVNAAEQMDNEAKRKGRSNRVSSKAPASGEDRSERYGRKAIAIKARKLERARLRGKPDAQHVTTHTTDDILDELGQLGADGKYAAYARKDREFHHAVDFLSADEPDHVIPNRFLIRDDMAEIHDSDSESESDVEEVEEEPVPLPETVPAPDPEPPRRRRNRRHRGNRESGVKQ